VQRVIRQVPAWINPALAMLAILAVVFLVASLAGPFHPSEKQALRMAPEEFNPFIDK
jgi:hypothetical protein